MMDNDEVSVDMAPGRLEVDAVARPMLNSRGHLIARTPAALQAFWRYFGDSKATDELGRPLVCYHGTSLDFGVFSKEKLGTATGHSTAQAGYFASTDSDVAGWFGGEKWEGWPLKRAYKAGANIKPLYFAIQNPEVIKAWDFLRRFVRGPESFLDFVNQAIASGRDGVLIRRDVVLAESMGGDEYGADTWVAFDAKQLKSAIGNPGSFSKRSEHITDGHELVLGARLDMSGVAKSPGDADEELGYVSLRARRP